MSRSRNVDTVTTGGRLAQKMDIDAVLDCVILGHTSEDSGYWESLQLEIDEAKYLVELINRAISVAQTYKDAAAQRAYEAKVALYEQLKQELGK